MEIVCFECIFHGFFFLFQFYVGFSSRKMAFRVNAITLKNPSTKTSFSVAFSLDAVNKSTTICNFSWFVGFFRNKNEVDFLLVVVIVETPSVRRHLLQSNSRTSKWTTNGEHEKNGQKQTRATTKRANALFVAIIKKKYRNCFYFLFLLSFLSLFSAIEWINNKWCSHLHTKYQFISRSENVSGRTRKISKTKGNYFHCFARNAKVHLMCSIDAKLPLRASNEAIANGSISFLFHFLSSFGFFRFSAQFGCVVLAFFVLFAFVILFDDIRLQFMKLRRSTEWEMRK